MVYFEARSLSGQRCEGEELFGFDWKSVVGSVAPGSETPSPDTANPDGNRYIVASERNPKVNLVNNK